MSKILIIEDDQKIMKYLELELLHSGYQVETAEDGKKGLELIKKNSYSLILLDLMMPKISGEDVCKEIRKKSNVPIIILTAKDETFSKINLLDLGADDYITKPFHLGELLARIRVIFRNKSDFLDINSFKFGKVEINFNTKEVFVNADKISLTKTEYNLLNYLVLNKNIVLSRDKILEALWGYEYFGDGKIIDIYINSLRKKVDSKSEFIKTIRGFGYSFRVDIK